MRTLKTILAASLIAASITASHAATLTAGYANVSLNTGNGLSSSVSALHLAAQTDLPGGYDLTASVTHGKREAARFTDAHTLMATSNSPACGQSNSPRQDGWIMRRSGC